MLIENGSFALSELCSAHRNQWCLLTPAHRNSDNRVDVWDLVDHFEKKTDALCKKEKLRKSGLHNLVLYWCKPCQCNIKLIGKDDEDVWKPNEVSEFFRAYYGIGV